MIVEKYHSGGDQEEVSVTRVVDQLFPRDSLELSEDLVTRNHKFKFDKEQFFILND